MEKRDGTPTCYGISHKKQDGAPNNMTGHPHIKYPHVKYLKCMTLTCEEQIKGRKSQPEKRIGCPKSQIVFTGEVFRIVRRNLVKQDRTQQDRTQQDRTPTFLLAALFLIFDKMLTSFHEHNFEYYGAHRLLSFVCLSSLIIN